MKSLRKLRDIDYDGNLDDTQKHEYIYREKRGRPSRKSRRHRDHLEENEFQKVHRKRLF